MVMGKFQKLVGISWFYSNCEITKIRCMRKCIVLRYIRSYLAAVHNSCLVFRLNSVTV